MRCQGFLSLPPLEDLKEYLSVDESSPSGLRWIKPVRPGRIKPGDVAGKQEADKSWAVRFRCKRYKAHRIVFYLCTGENLEGCLIDHKDLDPSNNKIENLRKADNSKNQANTLKRAGLTSKYKGVSWSKQANKWKAGIYINKKQKHLGYFEDGLEAAFCYDRAAGEHFGAYAKLNF